MKAQFHGRTIAVHILVSSFAIACTLDSEPNAVRDSDSKGDIDWRTVVDNAEQNNGFRFNGFRFNGFRFNGFRFNGFRFNGFRFNGEELANVHMHGNILRAQDPQGGIISGVGLADAKFEVDFVDPEDALNTASLEFEISDTELTANGLVLSTVRHRELPNGDWVNSCENQAKAVQLRGDWDLSTGERLTDDSGALSFACLGAALGDCAAWGYIPGEQHEGTPLAPYHEACTRLKRADYCGNGVHHTQNGHVIDIYDDLNIQSPVTIGAWDVEAMWSPDGALCASTTRKLDYSTDNSPQGGEYIGCEVPACEDVNQDGVIDFADYPTAILANRTVPSWRTRDFTVYTFYREWRGVYLRKSSTGGNTFGPPVEVTPLETGDENGPRATIDDSGNIHVIFATRSGPFFDELRHSVSTDDGQSFSPPQKISVGAGSLEYIDTNRVGTVKAFHHEIAHDPAGNLHVVFDQESAGVMRTFYSKSSDSGASWSAPIALDAASEESWLRSFLVDSNGTLHLLYGERSSALWGVHYRKSDDSGASWSPPVQLSDGANNAFEADIILDSGGNPHVAYAETDAAADSTLFYRRSTDGGDTFASAGSAIDTSGCDSATSCRIESVKLQLDSNEHPHIAYENHLWGEERIFYVKSPDGTTFNAPVAVDETRIENWSIYKLHFFLAPDDSPMIAWQDMVEEDSVFSSFLTTSTDGGTSFTPPAKISSAGGSWDCVYEFAAVKGPDGTPYFAYSQYDNSTDVALIYLRNSPSLGKLGPTVQLSNFNWDGYPAIYIK